MVSCFTSCFGQESRFLYEIPYSIAPQYYTRLTDLYIIVKDSSERCAIYSLSHDRFVSEFVYDEVEIIGKGFFMTTILDRISLTDTTGNDLTKRGEYNNFIFISDNVIAGFGFEQQCYYNIKTGRFVDISQICQNHYLSMDGYDHSNCSPFYDWNTGRCGLIDAENRIVVDAHYKDIRTPVNGLIAACDADTGKWGVINRKGELLIPFEYNDIYVSSADCFTFRDLKGKWGVCNMKEECIIKPVYEGPVIFNDNTAIVVKDEQRGVIDTKGNLVIPMAFSEIVNLGGGFFKCKDSKHHVNLFNNHGIKLFEKTSLTDEEKDDLRQKDGFIALNHQSAIAYYDSSGKSYADSKYLKVENFSNGFARVLSKNHQWGVINNKFQEVVSCEYDWIYRYCPDEKILVYGKQTNNYATLFVSVLR